MHASVANVMSDKKQNKLWVSEEVPKSKEFRTLQTKLRKFHALGKNSKVQKFSKSCFFQLIEKIIKFNLNFYS